MKFDISAVKSSAISLANKTAFTLKKRSPEILTVLGVGGLIASGVTACMATTTLEEMIAPMNDGIEKTRELKAAADEGTADIEYTDKQFRKDITIYNGRKALALVKLYGPSVGLAAVSSLCIFKAHKILSERNAALAAAYTGLSKTFKTYRERVKERWGEEAENEIRYGITKTKIEETTTDENGKERKKKVDAPVANVDGATEYARYFIHRDAEHPYGTECDTHDPIHDATFISMMQTEAQRRLISHGRLFLNEAYDMLGFPPTKAGQVVGWVYDPAHGKDDYKVEFNIRNYYVAEQARREGVRKALLIDFNVQDEPIFDTLEQVV